MTAAPPLPPEDPTRCPACRGTGEVISNKGGEPHTLPCPWCEGTRHRIPEHDAQAAGRGEAAETEA